MILLAGDIGGTHTRLILAKIDSMGRQILAIEYYPSQEFPDLVTVVQKFYKDHLESTPVTAACFAVAGPVIDHCAAVTNLPWTISEVELSKKLDIAKVKIINDFTAVTCGISELKNSDTLTLQEGHQNTRIKHHPDAAVIGAGTGLGVSHRVWTGNQYQAFSSEAGHTGFAPENELQCQLLAWLQKKSNHVSLEMLLSGNGIYTIYRFLHESYGMAESPTISAKIKHSDPAKIITESALSKADKLCVRSIECFVDIYGAAAGNVALNYFPVDEVYIAGGIAAKISDQLASQRFINAFICKGPMTENMKNIRVKLITQEKVGLYGALTTAQSI